MQKGFVIIPILIGLVIIGGVAGAWYTKLIQIPGFAPPGCRYQKVQCIQAPCDPILVCGTLSLTVQPTPTTPTAPDETTACVKEKQKQFGESKFKKGDLIVGFKITDPKEAQTIIKSYGLGIESVGDPEHIQPLTIDVAVPTGEEFFWLCKLQQNPNIEAVSLNFILNI
ncbi:hypothetical protein HYU45_01265 [Candidatus Daviesbacteria bacterium]|nr:hypothetical protein [Candidatus Daviesbacteria bacterium]